MMTLKQVIENADDDKIKQFLCLKIKENLQNYRSEISILLQSDEHLDQFLEDISSKEIVELRSNKHYQIDEYIDFSTFILSKINLKKSDNSYKFRKKGTTTVGSKSTKRIEIWKELELYYLSQNYKNFFDPIEYESFMNNFELFNKNEKNFLTKLLKIIKPYVDLQRILYSNLNYEKYRPKFRMDLINSWGINYCPYCNANEIKKYDKNEKSTGELDHLLPKNYFPLFALSYGNFIVSCSECNQKFKNANISDYVYDRKSGFGDDATFNYTELSLDSYLNPEINNINLCIDINNKENEEMLATFIKEFKLKDIYKTEGVKTEVCSMFRAVKRIYNRGNKKYIELLVKDGISNHDIQHEMIKFIKNKELNEDELTELFDQYLPSSDDKWKYINKRYGKCKSEILDLLL